MIVAQDPVTIDMGEVAKNLHFRFKVVGMTKFRIRMFLGLQLIRLAAAIAGVQLQIDDVEVDTKNVPVRHAPG